jgi:hypothetical protein
VVAYSESDPSEDERDWLFWSLFGIESVLLLFDVISLLIGSERFKRLDKPTIIAATGIGVVHIALMMNKGFNDENDFLTEILPDVVMTLSEPCSCLRLSKNPYALGAFGVVDLLAFAAAIASLCLYPGQLQQEASLVGSNTLANRPQ